MVAVGCKRCFTPLPESTAQKLRQHSLVLNAHPFYFRFHFPFPSTFPFPFPFPIPFPFPFPSPFLSALCCFASAASRA